MLGNSSSSSKFILSKKSKNIGKIIKQTLKCLLVLIMTALIILIATVLFQKFVLKKNPPMVMGYGSAVVISGSMEPAININDAVIFHDEANEGYKLGDVVVYESGSSLVTHRVVEINGDKLTTKGDANNTTDPPITADKVVGKIVYVIPNVGNVIFFIASPLGCAIILLGILFLYNLPKFITAVASKKR